MPQIAEIEKLFWGLVLKPDKRYEQIPERDFHISKACLVPSSAKDDTEITSVYLDVENEEFLIGNLRKKDRLDCTLDLNMSAGSKICFRTVGSGSVHLTGYLVPEEEGPMGYEDMASEDEDVPQLINGKGDFAAQASDEEDDDDDDEDEEDSDEYEDIEDEEEEKSPGKANKEKKPEQRLELKKQDKPKANGEMAKMPKKTIKGGIIIEDIKLGNGPEAKSGKRVGMYYDGKLKSNNKRFDKCLNGKPFDFRLGAGEVIKGWDFGIQGLKVGGKRRLTIPPKMGYGGRGAPPDIPPNATLVFDVECKFVK